MEAWGIVGRKSQTPQKVTEGRFEIEREGQIAFLEYSMAEKVLVLIHTQVPTTLRGLGLASSLAETALQYARQNNLKVDVICPSVLEYIAKHPEYSDLRSALRLIWIDQTAQPCS
jgi:predicted GNAT family acetyltransferase